MNLISNELIDKVRELGFNSYFGRMSKVNEECYHLWMADLQKYFREVHDIHIEIQHWKHDPDFPEDKDFYLQTVYTDLVETEVDDENHYETYEQALEAGLLESLTFIKTV